LDAAKPSVKEIGDAVDEIVEQIEKSEPDISKIVGAGKVINRLLDAVLIGGGVFALSAMKVLGDKAGERYADALLDKAEETLITLLKWFESINFSF
jgi:ATP-dependent protease HslVU (ClpYQ) peptidase subunit